LTELLDLLEKAMATDGIFLY